MTQYLIRHEKTSMLATPQIKLYEELLKRSWQRLCQQLDLPADQAFVTQVYQELLASYAEPHRAYHSVQHLAECISLFEQVSHLAVEPTLLEIALWFHDAIYKTHPLPKQSTHKQANNAQPNSKQLNNEQISNEHLSNEQKSANWAAQFLKRCKVNPIIIQQVNQLIMATQHHQASNNEDKLMVDIDLAILGAMPARFAEYQQQIREEYDFVALALFNIKRREVLAGFYQRPRIYQTDYFYSRYEKQARENLQAALANDNKDFTG
ncbi:HD domain-containing protein [Alkanindiges illinoisensis]|uniref:HD domain-containing protein n=1 Tax=Alkanindiges illinoisensis TaxID=197183 RepID=UPI000683FDBE|nr:hypothetical protein [Alkanindiges illinoisensis]